MRVLYTTDIHGVWWKYETLVRLAVDYRADAVVNGGDLLSNEAARPQQQRFIMEQLDAHFEKFDRRCVHYLLMLGNDDLSLFDGLFEEVCERHPFVHNLAQRKHEIDGYEFIGMNWVVDYPFRLKDRCRMDDEDYVFQEQFGSGLLSTDDGWKELADWQSYARWLPTLEEELGKLPLPQSPERAIYVIHMPPAGVGFDRCAHGAEVGSRAVHRFIRRHQPLLTLHGHIHESPDMTGVWKTQIGRTHCVQPGQGHDLTFVMIDLDAMQIERTKVQEDPQMS